MTLTPIDSRSQPQFLLSQCFCGSLNGYFKGYIGECWCNGEFTSYRLNNAELKGIFIGTMNAYGDIKKSTKTMKQLPVTSLLNCCNMLPGIRRN